MRYLRTLPTSRLLALLGLSLALCVAAAAGAVVASGGGGETPPPKPLAEALHDSLTGPPVDGVTARVTFTNKLFPSGALLGSAGPVLMSGGSGRLWLTNDGHGRIELQSNLGDAQIVWSPTAATVYDASSNTVYKAALPQAGSGDAAAKETPPTLAEITDLLTKVGVHVALSEATPANVGGIPAYTVALSPKHDGGLLGAVEVSWDAAHAVPLRAAIYAQGASSPVLELTTSDISYGAVDASSVDVAPPANAKVVDLGQLSPGKAGDATASETPATGLAAVQAAVDFPVSAPDTLVGLPRQDVRLVGDAESQTVARQLRAGARRHRRGGAEGTHRERRQCFGRARQPADRLPRRRHRARARNAARHHRRPGSTQTSRRPWQDRFPLRPPRRRHGSFDEPTRYLSSREGW